MRQLSGEQWAMLGGALLLVGFGGYTIAARLQANAGLAQPGSQEQPEGYDARARLGLLVAPDGHSRIVPPEHQHEGYVYAPHRYPRSVGGNVSNVIHCGWSMMRVPSGDPAAQWIVSPPSEAAW